MGTGPSVNDLAIGHTRIVKCVGAVSVRCQFVSAPGRIRTRDARGLGRQVFALGRLQAREDPERAADWQRSADGGKSGQPIQHLGDRIRHRERGITP